MCVSYLLNRFICTNLMDKSCSSWLVAMETICNWVKSFVMVYKANNDGLFKQQWSKRDTSFLFYQRIYNMQHRLPLSLDITAIASISDVTKNEEQNCVLSFSWSICWQWQAILFLLWQPYWTHMEHIITPYSISQHWYSHLPTIHTTAY